MTEGKGTYSLISVDVAPDEEVVRVDAKGIHREGGGRVAPEPSCHEESPREGGVQGAASEHVASADGSDSCGNAGREAGTSAPVSSSAAETDSYDGRDDLEGPVPMAGMQRVIIAAVVVCLIAFIVYFAVSHG